MLTSLFDRITSWPTTAFGLAVAAGWAALAQTLPSECVKAFSNYTLYGPAVLVAVAGALMKGGKK